MATAVFRASTGKLFPIEGYVQNDTLAVCKEKFSAQTCILVEHMPEVAQSGKPLVDEQSVSGTMDLVVKPMMIEYSFLTNPKKGYKAPASGYKGTFLNSEMNNYSYTQGNLIDKQDPNGPRMIPRTL